AAAGEGNGADIERAAAGVQDVVVNRERSQGRVGVDVVRAGAVGDAGCGAGALHVDLSGWPQHLEVRGIHDAGAAEGDARGRKAHHERAAGLVNAQVGELRVALRNAYARGVAADQA